MSTLFTIKVFFRGDWCPWCNAYLSDFNKHLSTIEDMGGRVLAITSQAGNKSKTNNNLDFDVIVDENNVEAAKYDIFVTPKAETPLKDVKDAYPHGMVQPGVVIEDATGNLLYRWAIISSEMNLGGASDRPLVSEILGGLEHILTHKVAPNAFATTDMAYLEAHHPETYQMVQAYLAGLNETV